MSLRIKLLRCFYSCKSNRKQWKCYSFLDSLYSHDQAAAFNETNTKQQTTIATQPSIEQLKIQIFPSEVGRDQNRAKRVSILGFIIHQVVWHTIPNSSQSEQLAAWLTELTCNVDYSYQQLVVTLVICCRPFVLSINSKGAHFLLTAPLTLSAKTTCSKLVFVTFF